MIIAAKSLLVGSVFSPRSTASTWSLRSFGRKRKPVEAISELGARPVSKCPELDGRLQTLNLSAVLANLLSKVLEHSNIGVVVARNALEEAPHQSKVGNYVNSFGMKLICADAIGGDPVIGTE